MVRAPEGATCPTHEGAPAPTVCERCGAFMCRECSARYVEERCAKCRPRFGPPELTERRLARVAKLPFLRCDVCGLEGPRFDRVLPVSVGMLLIVPLLSMATFGVLGLLYLATAINSTQPMCPGCERSDGLEPSLKSELPRPPGWDELTRAQRPTRVRNALLVLASLGTIVLGVFAFFRWA